MTQDLATAERDCQLAIKLQSAIEWAVWLGVLRISGYEAFDSLQATSLRNHMDAHFLEGLEKLGIPSDAPDAVKCALYHSLSNDLGGNKMSHALESDEKAWIFYHAPYGNNPLMGISYMVIRPSTWMMQLEAWHGNDGLALGNDRLAFVATHFIQLGDPYDAGYFIDTGRVLEPSERFQINVGESLPAGLAMQWPSYDPTTWPAIRRWKAHRNYARGFASASLATVALQLPSDEAGQIIDYALRTVHFATVSDVCEATDLSPEHGMDARQFLELVAHTEAVSGTDVSLIDDDGAARLVLHNPSYFSAKEWDALTAAQRLVVASAAERAWNALALYLTGDFGIQLTMVDGRMELSPSKDAESRPALGHDWTREDLLRQR